MKKLITVFSIILLVFCFYGCADKTVIEADDPTLLLTEEEEATLIVSVEEEKIEEERKENKEEEVFVPFVKTYIRSKVDSLSVRSEPDLSGKRVGLLDAGDMVVFCEEEGAWYKTYYRGKVAYVSADSRYSEKVDMEMGEGAIETVISLGEKLLGTPYVYGATRLHDGYGNKINGFTVNEFDCSSYMQYIFYYGADVVLHSTTRTQVSQGAEVERSELKRGDLIFMTNSSRKTNTGIERIGHVALYLGENYILHTASDHAVIEQMTAARWENYITARRMI